MGNLITMPGNKLSNERINAAKAMQGHHEAIAAFDALYARWLAAWANTVKPIKRKSENNLDAEVDKLDDLTWELALPQRRVTPRRGFLFVASASVASLFTLAPRSQA